MREAAQKALLHPPGKRQDAASKRQNGSAGTPLPEKPHRRLPSEGEKRCRRSDCPKCFTPRRVDQEYCSPKCRKTAWMERSYTGPIAELRARLEDLLAHCERYLSSEAHYVSVGYAEQLRADIAAARQVLLDGRKGKPDGK